MSIFNVLSGLQEGSYSVVTVSRASTGATFVKGTLVKTDTSGTLVAAATSADYRQVEWVFEDLSGNSSKKYSVIFGAFEAETDQIDDSTNGAIGAGDLLTCVAGKLAKASANDLTAGAYLAKCIATKAASTDFSLGTPIGKVVQFRILV